MHCSRCGGDRALSGGNLKFFVVATKSFVFKTIWRRNASTTTALRVLYHFKPDLHPRAKVLKRKGLQVSDCRLTAESAAPAASVCSNQHVMLVHGSSCLPCQPIALPLEPLSLLRHVTLLLAVLKNPTPIAQTGYHLDDPDSLSPQSTSHPRSLQKLRIEAGE